MIFTVLIICLLNAPYAMPQRNPHNNLYIPIIKGQQMLGAMQMNMPSEKTMASSNTALMGSSNSMTSVKGNGGMMHVMPSEHGYQVMFYRPSAIMVPLQEMMPNSVTGNNLHNFVRYIPNMASSEMNGVSRIKNGNSPEAMVIQPSMMDTTMAMNRESNNINEKRSGLMRIKVPIMNDRMSERVMPDNRMTLMANSKKDNKMPAVSNDIMNDRMAMEMADQMTMMVSHMMAKKMAEMLEMATTDRMTKMLMADKITNMMMHNRKSIVRAAHQMSKMISNNMQDSNNSNMVHTMGNSISDTNVSNMPNRADLLANKVQGMIPNKMAAGAMTNSVTSSMSNMNSMMGRRVMKSSW